MPKPIATGRHAAELAAEYRLTGHLPLRLDETIVPVAIVSELAREIEGRPCVGTQVIEPALGQVGEILVRAPDFTAPEFEAHLSRLTITAEVLTTLGVFLIIPPSGVPLIDFNDGGFNIDGQREFLDRRLLGKPRLLIRGKSASPATPGVGLPDAFVRPADGQSVTIDFPIHLHNRPGAASLVIRANEVDVDIMVTAYWTEHDLEVRDR